MNTPSNTKEFEGEFILFFSEDPEPQVLAHSIFAEDIYAEAERILKKMGSRPTVIRVQSNQNHFH